MASNELENTVDKEEDTESDCQETVDEEVADEDHPLDEEADGGGQNKFLSGPAEMVHNYGTVRSADVVGSYFYSVNFILQAEDELLSNLKDMVNDPDAIPSIEAWNLPDIIRDAVEGEMGDRFVSDLREMVNNPERSDITFVCKDGFSIHACRWVLVHRCGIFRSMLSNGMMETRQSEIPLPKLTSAAVLSTMEYLYTGLVQSYFPKNWEMGLEVIRATEFFQIPKLSDIICHFLRFFVSKDVLSQKSLVLKLLNVAADFPEMWDRGDDFLMDLVDVVDRDSVWAEKDFEQRLSRSAMDYIIENAPTDCHLGESEQSVEVYLRLRKIVTWHVHQVLPTGNAKVKGILEKFLPGVNLLTFWERSMVISPADIDAFISEVGGSLDTCDSASVLNSLLGTNISKDSLQHILQRHIQFERIPASLLLNVVHPLGIISSRQLLKGLFRGLCQNRVQCSMPRKAWKHGSHLTASSIGEIWCKTNMFSPQQGVAIAFLPPPRPSEVYEWSFEVLDNDNIIELGFVPQAADRVFEEEEILENTLCDLMEIFSAGVLSIAGRTSALL